MVAERAGRKEYCSDNCRARHPVKSQTESGEQGDYMWLRRLGQGDKEYVDCKLTMPEVVERLSGIEQKWPKLAKKAGRLLERANDPVVQLARSVRALANDPSVQESMAELADDPLVQVALSLGTENDQLVQGAISLGFQDNPSVQKARKLLERDDPTGQRAIELLKRCK